MRSQASKQGPCSVANPKEGGEVTTRRKRIVTLIGFGQARVGTAFVHRGPGSKCESCEYLHVCVKNLERERVYKVVKVREKTLPCRLYETEMRVVEVVEAEIPAAVPARQAIGRAVITFHVPDCEKQSCENYELCFPTGLMDGDRCEILEVTENLRCSEGSPLRRVVLRRVPVS